MEIKEVTDWININKEWLFSGVGIVIIASIYKFFIKDKETNNIPLKQITDNENNIVNEITINTIEKRNNEILVESTKYEQLEDLKNNIKILFIDDDTKFKVVNILKNAGYNNIKIIKDIKSLEEVESADILFIDIQGVGKRMGFKDEGLGLANALMDKYKNKKKYIIYSAETHGDRFNDVLRQADDFLSKDADPYQFESIIEKFFLNER